MRYASDTSVSSEKSRIEIERTLQRYGAGRFMYGYGEDGKAMVAFELMGRRIRFVLNLPDRNDARFTKTPGRGRARNEKAVVSEWEKACRQRWRALALVIKAKLEAVESGICEFDEEFLAHIVLPNNQTFGQFAVPQIGMAYEKGTMPRMLEFSGA